MEQAAAVIDLRSIYKRFFVGDSVVEALKDVSLTVGRGEYLGVLGPSGSGKSTLMNLIGCMDTFQEGEYYLMGLPIHEMEDEEMAVIRNRMVGFIFQKYHLIGKYTVLQNVMMPLLVRGVPHKEAMRAALEKLELLEMTDRVTHRPSELSGGQQQRVAIARALVGEPKLLLADEPTGALDTRTGREVLKLFQKLNDMGHTIVMITHDMQVAAHARRVVHIVDGALTD
ncbi:MAG TPA: ABC transporter ATP-binding protein [Feifaniaceae bacterium]|nr:ABC transporter ATP-binding protein [Feifaniaceae bacterium]